MNTDHLRYLLTIAECRSINKASEQLFLKQQYLSTLVKSLESFFGIRIFDRNYRGVTLTPDGEYLITQIRIVLPIIDQMQMSHLYPSNLHHRHDEMELYFYTIAQISSRTLSKCIQEFCQAFPKITLTLFESSNLEIIDFISNNPYSVGIISATEPVTVIRQKLPSELSVFFLRIVKMVALTSINNPFAQKLENISCKELIRQELLVYAGSDVEKSLLYTVLAPYGKLNIKNVMQNSALFFDILRNSNYFSLGEYTIAQRENLLAVPLQEDLQLYVMLVVNNQALDFLPVQTLINMFMTNNGQSVIHFSR